MHYRAGVIRVRLIIAVVGVAEANVLGSIDRQTAAWSVLLQSLLELAYESCLAARGPTVQLLDVTQHLQDCFASM